MHIFFSSVNELLKMKEELTKERDEQLNDIVKLRESLAQATSQQQKLESDKKECEEKIQEVIKVLVFNIKKKKIVLTNAKRHIVVTILDNRLLFSNFLSAF